MKPSVRRSFGSAYLCCSLSSLSQPFTLLTRPRLAVSATYLLTNVTRARVSLGRINEFITDTEELDSHPREFEGDSILVEDAKFRWSRFGSTGFELVLDKLEIPMGKTTIVAGEVGSGKTMLLLALMGELTKREGSVKWPARTATSYASQAPWLQGAFGRSTLSEHD